MVNAKALGQEQAWSAKDIKGRPVQLNKAGQRGESRRRGGRGHGLQTALGFVSHCKEFYLSVLNHDYY